VGEITVKKMVFIVDDNEINLIAGKSALDSEYNVIAMLSAKKMFDIIELQNKIPDLILLDVEMPNMNGLDAIHELKKREKWKSIPVIFLTAWADEGLHFDAVELGALDVIGKPFDPDALVEVVRKYI